MCVEQSCRFNRPLDSEFVFILVAPPDWRLFYEISSCRCLRSYYASNCRDEWLQRRTAEAKHEETDEWQRPCLYFCSLLLLLVLFMLLSLLGALIRLHFALETHQRCQIYWAHCAANKSVTRKNRALNHDQSFHPVTREINTVTLETSVRRSPDVSYPHRSPVPIDGARQQIGD